MPREYCMAGRTHISFMLLLFRGKAKVANIVQTYAELKKVNDDDCSQKTCKVVVSGDYTFVVGEAVIVPYGCRIAPTLTVMFHHPFK